MRMAICAAVGAVWAVGAGGHPSRTAAGALGESAVDSNPLAATLVGKWTGTRYDSGSSASHQFSITWTKASDGHLTGMVTPDAGSKYETNVVWSSDTGFVSESAPHQSKQLHEEVVTRMVSHVKGDSLWGTFEMRPMTYRGTSDEGKFSATRQH